MSSITNFLMLDPGNLKNLFWGFYKTLPKQLNYVLNEDEAYRLFPRECKGAWCTYIKAGCWNEFDGYLEKFKLDGGLLKELISEELHLEAECPRDILNKYRCEEIIQEINYCHKNHSLANHCNLGHAVLKITDQEQEHLLSNGDPAAWERSDDFHTAILFTDCKVPSAVMMNSINKARGIGRLSMQPSNLFSPHFVSSCLIAATMPIHAWINFWYAVNKKPIDVEYSYLLRLDYPKRKWHVEGQKLDHGVFILDKRIVKPRPFKIETMTEKELSAFGDDLYFIFKDYFAISPLLANTIKQGKADS